MRKVAGSRFARAIALTAGVALAAVAGNPASADNVTDAMIGAYNTSGLLEQNRALLRAADEDVAISVSALRPIIDWTVRVRQNNQRSRTNGFGSSADEADFFTGLTLDQLIYNGGAALIGKQSAQETVLSTRQALLQIEQQVLFRGVTAYLNVLLREETVAIRQNNVRLLLEELQATQDRFEVGEVTRTDVALSESSLANARANLADAQGALRSARAEYVNAVGREPGRTTGQPRLPQLPGSLGQAVNLSQRNHPSILSAQHQVRAFDLVVEQERAQLGPNVRLQANAGTLQDYGDDDYFNDATVALVLNQPIYAGGRLAANIRRAMANRDSSRANLLNVQKDIVQGVNDAYVRFDTAGASLTASTERVRAAQVAFEGIREEATLGARTTLDVLTAEQDLLDAKLAEVGSRTERSLAAYQLLQAQGLLTAERLGLAVQIYDPTLYYNLVKGAPAQLSKQSRDLDRVLKALRRD